MLGEVMEKPIGCSGENTTLIMNRGRRRKVCKSKTLVGQRLHHPICVTSPSSEGTHDVKSFSQVGDSVFRTCRSKVGSGRVCPVLLS